MSMMKMCHGSRERSTRLSVWFCAAAVVFGAQAAAAWAAPPIVSNFDRGAEGWIVRDLSCSNYNSVLGTYSVTWFATGGDPGGHIGRFDPSSNCYFFEAPASYIGNQSARIGGALRFSLRTNENDWPPGRVVVFIGDNNKILVHTFAQPNNTWQRFVVPLAASSFRMNTAAGPAVSEAQFAAVMTNLQAIRISAEHGAVVEETTWIDSVCFRDSLCAADLNCDGTVDVLDLLQLLNAWGTCAAPLTSCIADLTANGVVDVQDLLILLGAWGPCP